MRSRLKVTKRKAPKAVIEMVKETAVLGNALWLNTMYFPMQGGIRMYAQTRYATDVLGNDSIEFSGQILFCLALFCTE